MREVLSTILQKLASFLAFGFIIKSLIIFDFRLYIRIQYMTAPSP